jgi:hypothetical protein
VPAPDEWSHPTEGQRAILSNVAPVSNATLRADCPFDHPGQGTLYLYPGGRGAYVPLLRLWHPRHLYGSCARFLCAHRQVVRTVATRKRAAARGDFPYCGLCVFFAVARRGAGHNIQI